MICFLKYIFLEKNNSSAVRQKKRLRFATLNGLFDGKLKLSYKKHIILNVSAVKNLYLPFPAMISLLVVHFFNCIVHVLKVWNTVLEALDFHPSFFEQFQFSLFCYPNFNFSSTIGSFFSFFFKFNCTPFSFCFSLKIILAVIILCLFFDASQHFSNCKMLDTVGARIPNMFGIQMVGVCSVFEWCSVLEW